MWHRISAKGHPTGCYRHCAGHARDLSRAPHELAEIFRLAIRIRFGPTSGETWLHPPVAGVGLGEYRPHPPPQTGGRGRSEPSSAGTNHAVPTWAHVSARGGYSQAVRT